MMIDTAVSHYSAMLTAAAACLPAKWIGTVQVLRSAVAADVSVVTMVPSAHQACAVMLTQAVSSVSRMPIARGRPFAIRSVGPVSRKGALGFVIQARP